MPLSDSDKSAKAELIKKYGFKKGMQMFYASKGKAKAAADDKGKPKMEVNAKHAMIKERAEAY